MVTGPVAGIPPGRTEQRKNRLETPAVTQMSNRNFQVPPTYQELQEQFGVVRVEDMMDFFGLTLEEAQAIDTTNNGTIGPNEYNTWIDSLGQESPAPDFNPPEAESGQQHTDPPQNGQTRTFPPQDIVLTKVTEDDGTPVELELREVPFMLAFDQGNTDYDPAIDAKNNWRSFTTHDGFTVETRYQRLPRGQETVTNPDGAKYMIFKFSSGGSDSVLTPNIRRLGLDPNMEGITYNIVGKLDVPPGEDGHNGVYGSHDSAQMVIEIINPDESFTILDTPYPEGSITFFRTDADIEVLGGNYVDNRSDENYVTYNPDASLTIYHEDQGTLVRRINKLVDANPYGAYIGDDGGNNLVDNIIVFLNPHELDEEKGGKPLHGNGSYIDIKFS